MDFFWIVTLFHYQPEATEIEALEARAFNEFGALGVEEFSLSEAEVDAILGERSYSGGDLPETVLDEVEFTVTGKPQNYRFFFENEDAAEGFKKSAAELLCESQLEKCPQEDWNAEWKKHYSPIRVNEKIEVVPAWVKDHRSSSEKVIFINPGMGFGTGSHETTFLCLKIFTEIQRPFKDVLDFGSGSGILGLAALLFNGDARVDFYDIDPEANKNAYQNAELNALEDKAFRLLLPEVRDRLLPQYDVVFANILESILMLEKKALVDHVKPDGSLILSGLLRPQVDGIIEAYEASGMKLERREEKGDWAALLFTKS